MSPTWFGRPRFRRHSAPGGGDPVSDVSLSATVPAGWTATAAGPVTFASVPG